MLSTLRYKILFVKDMNGTPVFVGKKKLSRMPQTFVWRKQNITMDWTKPLFREKNTHIFLYDIKAGQMMTAAQKNAVDPDLVKAIFKDKVLQQLTAMVSKSSMFDITYIGMIILVALGVFAGLFVGVKVI